MEFTYHAYSELIRMLQDNGYDFIGYDNIDSNRKSVVLRHDIDISIDKALEIANIEHELGVSSTFFLLYYTDFYCIASNDTRRKLNTIVSLGHTIGLHFDEALYDFDSLDDNVWKESMNKAIINEAKQLENLLNVKVNSVSIHRPSDRTLQADLHVDGLVNTYGNKYFNQEFKYISDSRMKWHEDVKKIIAQEKYDKLQILTHPIWYNEKEKTLESILMEFINEGCISRYHSLDANFSRLDEAICECNVLGNMEHKLY